MALLTGLEINTH